MAAILIHVLLCTQIYACVNVSIFHFVDYLPLPARDLPIIMTGAGVEEFWGNTKLFFQEAEEYIWGTWNLYNKKQDLWREHNFFLLDVQGEHDFFVQKYIKILHFPLG